ncbi:hypothetical protein BJX63DRAFT_435934 [Aspergillus granulosus]|uniref:Granulins domain-containing protein n=1 Tax=Aspergillus granulosus TaxID=176169 RepID=A0ABR4H1G7_9EURO
MAWTQVAIYVLLLFYPLCFTAGIPSDWGFVNQVILNEEPGDQHIFLPPLCAENHCSDTEKCCEHSCIPKTHDCCSADEHCWPGDYCFYYDAVVRCCPLGMSCIQISGEVVVQQTIYWYEMLDNLDEDEGDWFQSAVDVTTKITIAASYTDEAKSSYSILSSILLEGAHIPPSCPTKGT